MGHANYGQKNNAYKEANDLLWSILNGRTVRIWIHRSSPGDYNYVHQEDPTFKVETMIQVKVASQNVSDYDARCILLSHILDVLY